MQEIFHRLDLTRKKNLCDEIISVGRKNGVPGKYIGVAYIQDQEVFEVYIKRLKLFFDVNDIKDEK